MPQLLPTCRLCVNLTGIRCNINRPAVPTVQLLEHDRTGLIVDAVEDGRRAPPSILLPCAKKLSRRAYRLRSSRLERRLGFGDGYRPPRRSSHW